MKIVLTTCSGRENLASSLKNQIPNLIVNFDDFTDTGKLKSTAYYNWQRSLKLAGDDACLQLEDDIVLCDNFLSRIQDVINKYPNNVIQFFSMRTKDITHGSRWESGSNFLGALCYYLPKGVAKQILLHSYPYLENTEYKHSPSDMCIRDFLVKHKMKYYIQVPNLVDHLPIQSSINPKRPRNRVSKTFIK